MSSMMGIASAIFLSVAVWTLPAAAATLTVDVSGGAAYADIQSAINVARTGDTVLVQPGEYVVQAPITFGGKAITVKSAAGAAGTTIRMSDSPDDPDRASVIIFESGETTESVLRGFTLTGGTGSNLANLPMSPGHYGGGIYCLSSSPKIIDCTVTGNSDPGQWSLFSYQGSGVFESCRVVRNTTAGNAFMCFGGRPLLIACTIEGNSYQGLGIGSADLIEVRNCLIVGNGGNAIEFMGNVSLINCTISGNRYTPFINGYATFFLLVNSIVWGNGNDELPQSDFWLDSSYNCGQSDSGEGTFYSDPLFVAPGHWDGDTWVSGDYHLQAGSPCIDTGTSSGAPSTDLDGVARPQGAGVDMGAYEVVACPAPGHTHCRGLEVKGPDGGGPGSYTATATAADDCGDAITYTFTARRGEEAPVVVGPQAAASASFQLGVGTWTISVSVDDHPGAAADAGCSAAVEVVPIVDCNGNGIADSVDIAAGTDKDCNRNGIPDSCDLAAGVCDACFGRPDPIVCPGDGSPAFRFGFRGPCSVTGEPGEAVTFDIYTQIETHCLSAGQGGARGLVMSIGLEGDGEILAAQMRVTGDIFAICESVDPNRIPSSGPLTGIPQGPGVIATWMDSQQTLDPGQSPQDIVKITVRGLIPAGGSCGECRLFWKDGLQGNMMPATNQVMTPETYVPLLTDVRIRFCPSGGLMIPGDANGDGALDLSDAVNTLTILFLGGGKVFPCGDGSITDPGNKKLVDWQPDGEIDLSDAVSSLTFQFLGGQPHALAPEVDAKGCVRIVGCSDRCGD